MEVWTNSEIGEMSAGKWKCLHNVQLMVKSQVMGLDEQNVQNESSSNIWEAGKAWVNILEQSRFCLLPLIQWMPL